MILRLKVIPAQAKIQESLPVAASGLPLTRE